MNGDEQIVARFMIEQLRPRKRPPASRAMITMSYPAVNGPTITEYFLPSAFQAGLRLEASGAQLRNAFVRAHAGAPGRHKEPGVNTWSLRALGRSPQASDNGWYPAPPRFTVTVPAPLGNADALVQA